MPIAKYSEIEEIFDTYSECKNEDSEVRTSLKYLDYDSEDNESEEDNDEEQADDLESDEEGDYELIIDFKDVWVSDFLENFNKQYRFPHMKIIHIDHLGDFNLDMRTLCMSTITSWDELYINQKALPKYIKSKVRIGSYLDNIAEVIPKVKETLLLGYFAINSRQFSTIIKAACGVNLLSFNCCQLNFKNDSLNETSTTIDSHKETPSTPSQKSSETTSTSEDTMVKLDLGDKEYQIQALAFNGWGKGFNGGALDVEGMKHILKEIGRSTMKDSLKQLCITWCDLSKETVGEILIENGLDNVKIWE